MAEKYNATCSICGKPYYVCRGCRDTRRLHPWKMHCCSPDCYGIFQVVKGFSTGVYTKDEFKSKLKSVNLSNLENYVDNIKALIKDVLKEEKPVVKTVEKVKPVVKEVKPVETEVTKVGENMVVEDVVEVEKTEDVDKPTVSRKRSLKVEAE